MPLWNIFQNVGWHTYFEQLQGFNEGVVVEFALNLEGNHSRAHGVEVQVTEEVISVVSALSRDKKKWFIKRETFPEL